MPGKNKNTSVKADPAPMSIGELLAANMLDLNQPDRARKIAVENDILRQQAMQGNTVLLENMPDGSQVWADESVLIRPSQITPAQKTAGMGVIPIEAVLRAGGMFAEPLIAPRGAAGDGQGTVPVGGQAAPTSSDQAVYDDVYNTGVQKALSAPAQARALYQQAMRDLLMSSLVR